MSNLNMCRAVGGSPGGIMGGAVADAMDRAVADAMYQAVHGAILQRETHPGLELYLKWVP